MNVQVVLEAPKIAKKVPKKRKQKLIGRSLKQYRNQNNVQNILQPQISDLPLDMSVQVLQKNQQKANKGPKKKKQKIIGRRLKRHRNQIDNSKALKKKEEKAELRHALKEKEIPSERVARLLTRSKREGSKKSL
jgi:hypothetical protein